MTSVGRRQGQRYSEECILLPVLLTGFIYNVVWLFKGLTQHILFIWLRALQKKQAEHKECCSRTTYGTRHRCSQCDQHIHIIDVTWGSKRWKLMYKAGKMCQIKQPKMVREEVKDQITITVQYGDPQGPDHALSAPIHSGQAFIQRSSDGNTRICYVGSSLNSYSSSGMFFWLHL